MMCVCVWWLWCVCCVETSFRGSELLELRAWNLCVITRVRVCGVVRGVLLGVCLGGRGIAGL